MRAQSFHETSLLVGQRFSAPWLLKIMRLSLPFWTRRRCAYTYYLFKKANRSCSVSNFNAGKHKMVEFHRTYEDLRTHFVVPGNKINSIATIYLYKTICICDRFSTEKETCFNIHYLEISWLKHCWLIKILYSTSFKLSSSSGIVSVCFYI